MELKGSVLCQEPPCFLFNKCISIFVSPSSSHLWLKDLKQNCACSVLRVTPGNTQSSDQWGFSLDSNPKFLPVTNTSLHLNIKISVLCLRLIEWANKNYYTYQTNKHTLASPCPPDIRTSATENAALVSWIDVLSLCCNCDTCEACCSSLSCKAKI